MLRQLAGTNIQYNDDENVNGYIGRGQITASGTLPTTTLTFSAGCRLVDATTGLSWINTGTATTPLWTTDVSCKQVSLTAANLIAMYTTPVVLIAPMPGYGIVIDSFEFDISRTSTAFTGGGVVAPQYDSTANGAGTLMTATIAATVVTGTVGRTITARIPVVQSDIATASITGIGIYLSNATAAFAAGTGTAVATIRYHIV